MGLCIIFDAAIYFNVPVKTGMLQNKTVDMSQRCYEQADIRMRSHGLWQLVDDKYVASYDLL